MAEEANQIGLNILGEIRLKLKKYWNNNPAGLFHQTDTKKRLMYQFGIGMSTAGTKSYVELDLVMQINAAGRFRFVTCYPI